RFLAALLRKELNLLERVRLRQHWRRLLHQLLDYWYWRGVAEKVQDKKKLHDLLKESKAKSTVHISKIEIDLQQGLEVAERMLDEMRPHSAIFRFGDHPVGKIPYEPGAERLRATHLRPFLATTLSWQLLTAMQRQLLLDYFDGDSRGLRKHRLSEDQTVFTQLTGPACVHQSEKKNDDRPDTRTHLSPGNILDYVEK
ncbi:MAG: hypothetical protein PHS86_15530, partial [Syntrophaceae bacterium]|nr:hypothetical protein [Syntrophaceae bacterium]